MDVDERTRERQLRQTDLQARQRIVQGKLFFGAGDSGQIRVPVGQNEMKPGH